MATNSKKKFAGLNVTAELQLGQDDVQTKPYEPVLSPEQRRILGQVYRLILSWRRERKMQPVCASSDSDMDKASAASSQAIALEVGA